MAVIRQFPRQALPDSRKGKKWQAACMEWGDSRTYMNFSPVRRNLKHKAINYDLINGVLHMEDVVAMLNPSELEASYFPETIQHFPIINSKLDTLIGEELQRPFDWRAIVTNMNAVSDIERKKKAQLMEGVRQIIEEGSESDEDYLQNLQQVSDYFEYDYQDAREVRANEFLKHYSIEYNFPLMFNKGMRDGLIVGEEIYFNDIVGGKPVVEKVNNMKLRMYFNGYSNKVEDADVIIYEDFWNPGRIIDIYGDQLTSAQIKFIEDYMFSDSTDSDSMSNIDASAGLVPVHMIDETFTDNGEFFWDPDGNFSAMPSMQPYDAYGNIRVMRMFWKSRRRIKKVKMYDQQTGEEYFEFFSDSYVVNTALGEEEDDPMWINEAWEGTMIGGHIRSEDTGDAGKNKYILVNVRPRPVQYPDMDNPSKCSLGFVGTIYNLNEDKPYSMVDMMKPYSYLYDVIHYRLMDTLASVWGSLLDVDLATVPEEWKIEQWMYFARMNHIAVRDSLREGTKGTMAGKPVGALNNNSQRMISDTTGNYIQQLMDLAAYIKQEMGEMVGITRQREGQISNRETVGGVERSVLQSSYITERYFAMHNDTKRRELEVFLETAKIAARGRKISFRYKLSDGSWKLMEFDGDEFAENNYGILVDASSNIKNLDQKIEGAAQAYAQNQAIKLSALMKIWASSSSLAEKIKVIEASEKEMLAERQQEQQMQLQQVQAQTQAQIAQRQAELQAQAAMNSENNETKILVAQIQADNKLQVSQQSSGDDDGVPTISPEAKAKIDEQIREFNLNLQQDNKKIAIQKERNDIARMAAKRRPSSSK